MASRTRAANAPQELLFELGGDYAQLMSLLDGQVALDAIAASVPLAIGADLAYIGLPNEGGQIVLQHAVGSRTAAIDRLVVPAGWGIGGKVQRSLRPRWVEDYGSSRSFSHSHAIDAIAELEDLHAVLAAPILQGGRMVAVLYAGQRTRHAFSGRTVNQLQAVAQRAGTALAVAGRVQHHADVAVQAERQRLAVELHDSVGALLFAIGAGLRGLESEPGLHPRLRSRLAALEQHTSDASATLRLSLQTLDVAPQDLELAVALRCDCHSFEDRTGIPARLVLLSETPTLSGVRTHAISQSVREALLNVEKHAHARSVVVTLSAQRHGVLVVVADDGAGPEPNRRRRSGGLGLRAIAGRLARLGGTTMLRRNEDGGATLRLWLPC